MFRIEHNLPTFPIRSSANGTQQLITSEECMNNMDKFIDYLDDIAKNAQATVIRAIQLRTWCLDQKGPGKIVLHTSDFQTLKEWIEPARNSTKHVKTMLLEHTPVGDPAPESAEPNKLSEAFGNYVRRLNAETPEGQRLRAERAEELQNVLNAVDLILKDQISLQEAAQLLLNCISNLNELKLNLYNSAATDCAPTFTEIVKEKVLLEISQCKSGTMKLLESLAGSASQLTADVSDVDAQEANDSDQKPAEDGKKCEDKEASDGDEKKSAEDGDKSHNEKEESVDDKKESDEDKKKSDEDEKESDKDKKKSDDDENESDEDEEESDVDEEESDNEAESSQVDNSVLIPPKGAHVVPNPPGLKTEAIAGGLPSTEGAHGESKVPTSSESSDDRPEQAASKGRNMDSEFFLIRNGMKCRVNVVLNLLLGVVKNLQVTKDKKKKKMATDDSLITPCIEKFNNYVSRNSKNYSKFDPRGFIREQHEKIGSEYGRNSLFYEEMESLLNNEELKKPAMQLLFFICDMKKSERAPANPEIRTTTTVHDVYLAGYEKSFFKEVECWILKFWRKSLDAYVAFHKRTRNSAQDFARINDKTWCLWEKKFSSFKTTEFFQKRRGTYNAQLATTSQQWMMQKFYEFLNEAESYVLDSDFDHLSTRPSEQVDEVELKIFAAMFSMNFENMRLIF